TEDGAYYLNGAMTDAALLAVSREADWQWAIPSEDEWYKAAYHKNDGVTGNYWDYPTGTDSAPGRDMTEVTNPGNNANYSGSPYPIDSGTYYATVAGEFELSDSPYGTFDQGGNMWEWNEAIMMDNTARCTRGGSFSYAANRLLASYRSWTFPTGEWFHRGFRVSQVPEPATLSLLALGALALIRRKRK
ncbi:MAG: formylglycine-generating enzyme family protein, partial [Planctomycetota bacterium]